MTSARIGTALLIILMMLYCIVGYTGFDPSRKDEAYIFGIILEYTRGHNWVVPLLAGTPFMEKPPLYYLLGALCAKLFSPWLPLHDAARLASALLTFITGCALAGSAHLLWGKGFGRFAALGLLSSLGLLVPSHMMLTDNAQLTGIAVALLGFAGAARERRWAGAVLGIGAGIAFLAKGLLGPGIIAATALLLITLWPNWRRNFHRTLIIAFLFCLPWLCIWPFMLYRASPALFSDWLLENNVGRFLGFAPHYLNAVKETDFWYTSLLWATLPVLPLALVCVYKNHNRIAQEPALQIGVSLAAAVCVTLALSSTLRSVYALPLLLAFALMAAPLLRTPSASTQRFLLSGGYLFFIAAALLVIKYIAHAAWLTTPISIGSIIFIGLLIAICGAGQYSWRSQIWRSSATWYSGLLCVAAVSTVTWLPAIENRASYRVTFEQLRKVLAANECVSSIGFGESQRGMLDYVLSLQTHAEKNVESISCNQLLVDGRVTDSANLAPEWKLIWTGKRSDDAREQFRLYARASKVAQSISKTD